MGQFEEALACHEESLELNQTRGSQTHAAVSRLQIALAHLYSGEWRTAEEQITAAERTFAEVAYPRGQVDAALVRCRILRRQGEDGQAATVAERALAKAEEISYKRGVVLALEEAGDLALARDDHREARRSYRHALELANEIAPEGDLVYELEWRLARVVLHFGEVERADSLAWNAVKLAEQGSDRRELGHALSTLALVRAAQEDVVEVRALLHRAIDELRSVRTPYELARTHELAARLLAAGRGPRDAEVLGHLLEARRLYARLGAQLSGRKVEDVLGSIRPEPAVAAGGKPTITKIVTQDDQLLASIKTARELGHVDSTVLLEGETGTGKELFAEIIHESGPRAAQPFVAINCAAIPPHLLESELFGHRRGAFTGADEDRQGVFAAAGGGTILLDEIDKASLELQAKLLRVIESGTMRPVGSTDTVSFRARVVCATNRDLRRLASVEAFLQDLYYRLARFRLRLPALRERHGDIPRLVDHFLDDAVGRLVARRVRVSPDAMDVLSGHDWPGNVRELKNVIEAAAFYARESGVIMLEHLPEEVRLPGAPRDVSLHGRIVDLERREILAALKQANGIKAEAARTLGVSRKGLRDRMRRLGLE